MRLAYYAGASTAAAAACLVKAFHERPNLYSATVYLSQSNACILILTNLLLLLACSMVYALQRLLYGPLRPIEIEQLSEKAWYAVLDTLLAMPSFREDVGGWLLTMFVLLLAGKVWGWIGEGRVDILEQQTPANPRLFHTRLANSLIFSVLFDIYMTRYCFETVAADPRPGMMVIFTFEFAILTVFSTFTLCRYILSLVSSIVSKQQTRRAIMERKLEIEAERLAARQNETEDGGTSAPAANEPIEIDENEVDVPGWEEKRRWLFGLEMTADFLKLLLYIVFFTVSVTFNALPMHIMRDVYMTFASFTQRLTDYVNYKKATSDMNARYPDATTDEIRDDACIVCREDMIAWQNPAADGQAARPRRDEGLRAKKLPCGHILHLRCLKAWLERQQVCPTCRRPVISAAPPPPPQQIRQANAVNAANGPAPPAAPGAAQQPNQQQQRPNRARFLNLGPLRIGFLNGPANQVDNLVNQLQGAAQAQPQAGNTQPPAPPQTAFPNTDETSRMSQNDIRELHSRLLREANRLNVEQAQLMLLRSMTQELNRLMSLHAANTATGRPVEQGQPALSPAIQGNLTGLHSQAIPAGSANLPAGLVLPQGWSLMPLRRQESANTEHTVHVAPTQTYQAGHPQTQSHPMQASRTVVASDAIAAPQSSISAAPTDAMPDPGPTDEAGSPLFVPAQQLGSQLATPPSTTGLTASSPTGAVDQPLETGPAASSLRIDAVGEPSAIEPTASTNVVEQPSQAVQQAPWTTSGWGFNDSERKETQDPQVQSSTDLDNKTKGKGRAVEIEDTPDAEA